MKTYLQIREIFPWLKTLHQKQADYYRACRANTQNRRAGMLLEFVEGQEIELAWEVAKYESNASRELLNTYFQYIPEQDDAAAEDTNGMVPVDINAAQAADLIIERSRRLEAVYRNMAEMAKVARTRQMFSAMAQMIHHQRQQAIESYDHLSDI